MPKYIKVGKLVATKGLNGLLLLKHSLKTKPAADKLRCLFIEDGSQAFIPYFVRQMKVKSYQEILLKFEGVITVDEAKPLLGKDAWLMEENFADVAVAQSPISLLGFTVVTKDNILGEIVEVIEQPQQLICKIMLAGKEVLIPVHEDSLIQLNHDQRILEVDLPDGLLDLYLH